MVASITRVQSPLNFLLNQALICYRPQISKSVPHFQNICYLSLCHDFDLHFGDETATYKAGPLHFGNIAGVTASGTVG
jgi:hypothetical protein